MSSLHLYIGLDKMQAATSTLLENQMVIYKVLTSERNIQ